MRDKIIDLFLQQDIDFPSNKKFSRKYKLIGRNPSSLKEGLSKEFLNYACELNFLELEVINSLALLSISKLPLSKESLSMTITSGKRINDLINK